MLKILIIMIVGIILGRITRDRIHLSIKTVTFILVWTLLLLLGYEAGGNDAVMHSIPTLGARAIIISSASIAGSIFFSCLLWHSIKNWGEER